MRWLFSALLASAALWVICGCGTLLDAVVRDSKEGHASNPSVYGGVQFDAHALSATPELFRAPDQGPMLAALCVAFWVVDLPISAIADTLALPFSLSAAYARPSNSEPAGSPQP
jgi:uncharacterized protein YceK